MEQHFDEIEGGGVLAILCEDMDDSTCHPLQ